MNVPGSPATAAARGGAPEIRRTAGGVCMYVGNGLEAYRVESFETKEPETVAWIRELMEDGDVFVDVGANVGIYSLYAALVHPSMTVYALEPYVPSFVRLVDNVRLNALDNVVPLPVALSDAPGVTRFVTADERAGGSGGQIDEPVDAHGERFDPVDEHPVVTLTIDACVSLLGIPVPQHVKIDVDGAEGRVLEGMRETLKAPSLRSVLVEVNAETTDFRGIEELLLSHGFSTQNPFQNHPEHSRHRRRGTRSASAVNLVAVRGEAR